MKYYAFFGDTEFFQTLPISIKKGPDYNLYLPRLCEEISVSEFNHYKQIGVPEELPFEEIDLSCNDDIINELSRAFSSEETQWWVFLSEERF